MAWIDDRLHCHPKFVKLTDRAFRAAVNAISYSAGFQLGGILEPAHQRAVGATATARRELVAAGLWDELDAPKGAIYIHDWDEHNGARDARRAADRERKRAARRHAASAGRPRDRLRTDGGQTCGPARVEGSEGSEGKTEREVLPSVSETHSPAFAPVPGHDFSSMGKLRRAVRADDETIDKLERAARGCAEADIIAALEACTGPGVHDKLAVALATLKKRRQGTAA